MNDIHETNRRSWNSAHGWWKDRVDRKGVWDRCHEDPSLVLSEHEMALFGDVRGKGACVLGSGDNEVVFALAGMGATLTSVDISDEQLATARSRAAHLGLDITFIQSDVTDLAAIAEASFDLVYTGGHVAVWVSDLGAYYSEAARILRPGGMLLINEYHPMRRIYADGNQPLSSQHRYLNRGPYRYGDGDGTPTFEFHWTVADYLQAVIDAGLNVIAVSEFGDGEVDDEWEAAGTETLPANLLIAARK